MYINELGRSNDIHVLHLVCLSFDELAEKKPYLCHTFLDISYISNLCQDERLKFN